MMKVAPSSEGHVFRGEVKSASDYDEVVCGGVAPSNKGPIFGDTGSVTLAYTHCGMVR